MEQELIAFAICFFYKRNSSELEVLECFFLSENQHKESHDLTGTIYGISQWAFTYLKLTIETLEQGVKYVQN